MQAGRLKYRITLLRPTYTRGRYAYGVTEPESGDWREAGTVHAERVAMRPRAVVEAGEVFADYTVEWNIRDVHEVAPGWRVRQVGGDLYDVTGVVPNIDRGYVTLTTQRVNE